MKTEYTTLVRDFLRQVNYETPPHRYDFTLESRVQAYFATQDFPPKLVERLRPIIKWSTGIALTAYPWVSPSIQRVIAIFTAYLIAIDDLAGEMLNDLKQFTHRLFQARPSENQLLRSLVRFLHEGVCSAYGQFAKDMMLKGTLDFITACYVEVELDGVRALSIPKDAQGFPYYFRLKNGIAEPYALMAFPPDLYPEDTHFTVYLVAIPELTYFFNAVNDIFSFYKESIVGTETGTFVSNLAIVHAVSPLRALEHLCQEAIRAIRRVRSILSVSPRMQQDIEQLFHGYILYHLSQSRYRLTELEIPEAVEARDLMKATFFQGHCDHWEIHTVSSDDPP
ncbi:terpenoid synthase [Aspergillus sclerotiicarbonarius CBS 121057]|uniref:Terpenoid synthase n=1 Tax=Aspergillus sclerotiicarbonarius (strain CBS 121057 / IBT 28362) TaxID=1448318 RepID=A0A319EF86_ASPSB|nr:terpenoid synthase [Aspergillus sclerotiicarbonarius CBS 121057]